MKLLVHQNILQVFGMHTIYVDDPKTHTKVPKIKSSDDSSGSLNLDSDEEESKKINREEEDEDDEEELDQDMLDENAQHADIIIIMEKADKTMLNLMLKRRKDKQAFTTTELLVFWKKIVNVFAFCTVFNISHNDIKPTNILLTKK
jgi:serine/threonine protein kinase